MTEAATIRPGPFFLLPKGIVDSLGRAALRALDCLLWEDTRYATEPSDATDRELAAAMGCSIRTAQRAIHDLANLVVDGVARPLIDRFRQYGPREVAGRRLRIIAPEVVPTAREDPEPAPPKPGAKGKPIPNVGTIPAATPEQLAAGRAAAATSVHRPIARTPEQVEETKRTGAALGAWLRAGSPGDFEQWRRDNPDAGQAIEPKPRC